MRAAWAARPRWQRISSAGAVGSLLVVAVVALSGTGSADKVGSGPTVSPSTTATVDQTAAVDQTATIDQTTTSTGPETRPAATATTTDPPVLNPDIVPSDELPLTATVTNSTGLADGEPLTIHVEADDGSQVYVAEARLCAGGTVVQTDSDMRPSRTGHCISSPLSAVSDDFVSVESQPPYASLDLTFRVGVGQESYTTQDGEPITITCDREHPCTLAVKYQVPYGYGFRTYPIEYR